MPFKWNELNGWGKLLVNRAYVPDESDDGVRAGDLRPMTARARKVVAMAEELSRRWRSPAIGSGHVLMALLEDEHGITGHVLGEFGITRKLVMKYLSLMSGQRLPDTSPLGGRWPSRFDGGPGGGGNPTQLPFPSDIMERAFTQAEALGHRHVGNEHLGIALFSGASCFINELCANWNTSAHLVVERTLELCAPSAPKVVVERASWTHQVQSMRLALASLGELSNDVSSISPELREMTKHLDSVERELVSASGPVGDSTAVSDGVSESVQVGDFAPVEACTLLCAIEAVQGGHERARCPEMDVERSAIKYALDRLKQRVHVLRALAFSEGWGRLLKPGHEPDMAECLAGL